MAIIYAVEGTPGKVCNTCKAWKPVSEFHRSSQMRDGHKADCKACRNAAGRAADAIKRDERCSHITSSIKPSITGKVCVGCHEWKPASDFSPLRWKGKPLGNGYRSRCKACSNARQRAKRAGHPTLFRDRDRAYIASRHEQSTGYQRNLRDKNREKVDRAGRAYREANREKIRIAAKRRRDSNIAHYRAIGRKAYANNIEKRRAYNRSYRKAHPERYREQVRTRRNRKYQAEGFHTEAEWGMLKAKYNYTCLRCSQREPEIILTRDHVLPITQGGSDWITNLQPLCHTCNSSKNNKYIDYRPKWPPMSETSSETSAGQQ
jgi:5-methylcytosine-specific restriction endonuclease McrA